MEKIFFQIEQFFFQPEILFFPIFPSARLQRNNEIINQNNLLGLRKGRKQLEKYHFSCFYVIFTLLPFWKKNKSKMKLILNLNFTERYSKSNTRQFALLTKKRSVQFSTKMSVKQNTEIIAMRPTRKSQFPMLRMSALIKTLQFVTSIGNVLIPMNLLLLVATKSGLTIQRPANT